jgi:hypothetical protein
MKRTITAIAVGTILIVSGSILPASATTQPQNKQIPCSTH